jgi:hypothetical protein
LLRQVWLSSSGAISRTGRRCLSGKCAVLAGGNRPERRKSRTVKKLLRGRGSAQKGVPSAMGEELAASRTSKNIVAARRGRHARREEMHRYSFPRCPPPRFPINPPTTSSLSLCNTQLALKVIGVCAGAACCCCSCSDGAGAAAAVLLLALHPRRRALGIATWPLPGCETILRNLRTGLSPLEQQKAPKPAPARSACAKRARPPHALLTLTWPPYGRLPSVVRSQRLAIKRTPTHTVVRASVVRARSPPRLVVIT